MRLQKTTMQFLKIYGAYFAFTLTVVLASQTAKAQFVLVEADEQFNLLNYNKAITLYTEAYQKKPTLHAMQRLATAYRLNNDYVQAESWYAMLTKTNGAKAEDFLYYGNALRNNSKYNEAKVQYQKYVSLSRADVATQNLLMLSCDSAMSWMKKPVAVVIKNELALNSATADWGATLGQSSVVFTSDRTNDLVKDQLRKNKPFLKFDESNKAPDKNIYGWTGNGYLRLYTKDAKDNVALFPFDAGSDYHVGAATFTANGNEMFFTLTKIPAHVERENGVPKTVKVELFSAKKEADGNWGKPVSFRYNNVNQYSVGDPFITKDGKTLYFVSDMPGGKGKTDIYYVTRYDDGSWSNATNMQELNTAGAERTPFLDNEGNLYFSTDGRIGMGGLDIFKLSKGNSVPVNLRYPINSPQDDFSFITKDSKEAMLASDRLGGKGSDDIYSLAFEENLSLKLEGFALAANTNKPLADVLVSITKADGTILSTQTDSLGAFSFNLNPNIDYLISGKKTGFRNAEAENINGLGASLLKKNIYLTPITLNQEIRIENIYYDFDKSNIRTDAALELDKLVKIMKENPTLWIDLGSHTDSRGNDKYNQKLSQARANEAVKYIIARGIEAYRVKAKGYGESRLLNDCTNDKPCSEEAHQRNRRTEFTIIKQ